MKSACHEILVAIVVPLALACGESAFAPSYPILVRVESDPGVPLAGAGLSTDGRLLATSDERGLIAANLRGSLGDLVAVAILCPPGYRGPSEPLSVQLAAPGTLPEQHARCSPLTRSLVIAVRATNGPDLPLRYLGQEIARTDANGAAHALLHAAPGEALMLTLDTSANTQLTPQQPELIVSVPERDELIVFDQAFTRPKQKRKHVR
jgi:hypothetical protein